MSGTRQFELLRGTLFHTPRNPFLDENALEAFADGGLLIEDGRVCASGEYKTIAAAHPEAVVRDWRGSVILPGLVDTHVHFPQARIIGELGRPLLDWLRERALPEELRMADPGYAHAVARESVSELTRHGTTSALVFGAHFGGATEALFDAAADRGLRVASGLVVSDRVLPDGLLQKPEEAHRISSSLIARYHRRGLLRYAVTPRFALSASEAMLEVCGALMSEHPGVLFQTHINENAEEIAEVRRAFPWSESYLAVYDRFGLAGARSVFAHSVHPTDAELSRMASRRAWVAHCPCSNAMLGSGVFPMRRHLMAGVRFALGTDVGAGTGFGMLKEALQCYMMQRVAADGVALTAAHLLYLATKAGAEALGLGEEVGDFAVGKAADILRLRLPGIRDDASPEEVLGTVITRSDTVVIEEVRVAGRVIGGSATPGPAAPLP